MPTLHFAKGKSVWGRYHLLLFCIPLFFIAMAETGMNFIFPLIVVQNGISNTVLGLMMGLSALVAIGVDVIFPKIKRLKTWKALLLTGIILASLFPILIWAGITTGIAAMFLFASFSWYVFYELIMMSQQEFVVGDDKNGTYSKDWGIIYFAYASASIAGPIIIQSIDAVSTDFALAAVLLMIFFSFIFAILAAFLVKDHHRLERTVRVEPEASHHSRFSYLSYFKLFSTRLFPMMILTAIAFFIEESFWNFGALLGDSLHIPEVLNWIVLIIFAVPMLIGPIILARKPVVIGKKRLAMRAVFLAGSVLGTMFFIHSVPLLLVVFFFTGVFLSFCGPLSDATFSDYLKRSGHSQFYLLSFMRVNQSIAYLLAPVLSGVLSDALGYKSTFGTLGVSAAIIAVVLFITTPKKIHLPQNALQELEVR